MTGIGMGSEIAGAAAWLQTSGMADRDTLLVIFVGVIAVCVLLITLGLIGAALFAIRLKAQVTKKIDETVKLAQAKAQPAIETVNRVVKETGPKVRSITDDVVEISHVVRAQVNDLDSTLSHATSKARSQVDRVNGMVSSTLDTTNDVVSALERGVKAPIREMSGLIAGLKAGFEVLAGRSTRSSRAVDAASQHVDRMEDEIRLAAARMRSNAERPAGVGASSMTTMTPMTSEGGLRTTEAAGTEFGGGGRASSTVVPGRAEGKGGRVTVEAGEEMAAAAPTEAELADLRSKTESAFERGDASSFRPARN